MKKSTKAALLSAFIFPGAGHFLLKNYVSGTVLMVAALISLGVLITDAVNRAMLITEKILSGDIQPELAVLMAEVTKQPSAMDARLIKAMTVVLVMTWLVGIVDAYRVGRLQEKE